MESGIVRKRMNRRGLGRSAGWMTLGLVLGLAGSAYAESPDAERPDSWEIAGGAGGVVGVEVCGHLDDMQRAREALASGDRSAALRHLKTARAELVECERRAQELDAEAARREARERLEMI